MKSFIDYLCLIKRYNKDAFEQDPMYRCKIINQYLFRYINECKRQGYVPEDAAIYQREKEAYEQKIRHLRF